MKHKTKKYKKKRKKKKSKITTNKREKNKNEKNDGFICFLREIMVILQTDTVLFLFCKKTKAGQ